MEAVARYVTAPATVVGDIGDLLSERHALEKSKKYALRTFARKFSNIDFFLKFLPLNDDELVMSEM